MNLAAGDCRATSAGFTCRVTVTDHRESGTDGTFGIQGHNGCSAAGTVKGGNLEIHN